MYKLLNKKGALLGPTLALITASIVITIILIISIFFTLASQYSGEAVAQEAEQAALKQSAAQSFKAYLHTPVTISIDDKNQEMEMIDLIRLATIDSNYKDQLEKETKESLGKVYGEFFKDYSLEIKSGGDFILRMNLNIKNVKFFAIENLKLQPDIEIKFSIVSREKK